MATLSSVDIVILTVLPEEYQAVLQRLANRAQRLIPTPNLYAWEIGEILSPRHGVPYSVAVGRIGRPGNVASALATVDAIVNWKPIYIFFVGIGGGLAETNKGDVVVADMIYGYEYGKLAEEFKPRRNQTFRSDIGVINLAQRLSETDPAWIKTISTDVSTQPPPKVIVGDVASGEKVVDDATNPIFSRVVVEWPKLVAVEMEGAGSAAAIEYAGARGQPVRFAMFRGISDLPRADQGKVVVGAPERDSWKLYAANSAAAFAAALISSGLPLAPHATVTAPAMVPDNQRLAAFGLCEPSDQNFGKGAFSTTLGFASNAAQRLQLASRLVILAALPNDPLPVDATGVLKVASSMLDLGKWYSGTGDDPKYRPPTIFPVPTTRRAAGDWFTWEDRNHTEGQRFSLANLAITGQADVCFVSAIRYVSTAYNGAYVFSLGQILADCWRLTGLVTQLYKGIGYDGLTSVYIGMVGTGDSHLGGFAANWHEPDNHYDQSYWGDVATYRQDWSCHSPNLRFQTVVKLTDLKPKQQPEFIRFFADAISRSFNHDSPRCFDAKTGMLPERFFRPDL